MQWRLVAEVPDVRVGLRTVGGAHGSPKQTIIRQRYPTPKPRGALAEMEKLMELDLLDEKIDGKSIVLSQVDPTRALETFWDLFCEYFVFPRVIKPPNQGLITQSGLGPKASDHIRTCPNRSKEVRIHPNRSEQLRKLEKTSKNCKKKIENPRPEGG